MAQQVRLDQLATALGLGGHELISLVGGGGKSTLLFALGRALRGEVILTTTTRMGDKQTDGLTPLVRPSDDILTAALQRNGRVLVRDRTEAGVHRKPGKAIGPEPEVADHWFDMADHVVVEADGARGRPFKAPGPHEPQIPSRSTVVIGVIGADSIGRCIGDQCFRPLRVAAVAGCGPYDRLTPQRAARVLASQLGTRKGVPSRAKFHIAITRVNPENLALVNETVDHLRAVDVESVLVADHG